jgi:hypothetical protein
VAGGAGGPAGSIGGGSPGGGPPVPGATTWAALVCEALPAGFEAVTVQRYPPAVEAVIVLLVAPDSSVPSRVHE